MESEIHSHSIKTQWVLDKAQLAAVILPSKPKYIFLIPLETRVLCELGSYPGCDISSEEQHFALDWDSSRVNA